MYIKLLEKLTNNKALKLEQLNPDEILITPNINTALFEAYYYIKYYTIEYDLNLKITFIISKQQVKQLKITHYIKGSDLYAI